MSVSCGQETDQVGGGGHQVTLIVTLLVFPNPVIIARNALSIVFTFYQSTKI
jgi:hypothetical protein